MRIGFGLFAIALSACSKGSDGSPAGGLSNGGSDATLAPHGGAGGAGAGGDAGGPSHNGAGGAAASGGAGAAGGATGSANVSLPEVYPPVRRATPTALINNPEFSAAAFTLSELGTARQALGEINLATAIQERFYSTGPTDLLRIVKALDDRVRGLDLDGAAHPCLTATPISVTYVLPAGQTFVVRLQCIQRFGTPGANAGWVGFGVEPTLTADAGAGGSSIAAAPSDAAHASADGGAAPTGSDFYLIEGQEGGNGGAYHIDPSGNIEAWIAVAEHDVPSNSQVIMHMRTHSATATLELALAGSGVGFCAAHLKTDPGFLFVTGKTNAPPPPGTEQAVGTQYCDAPRSGCFDASDLATDLGSDSVSCAGIGPSSFDIDIALDADASADAGSSNVVTSDIYGYFNQMPTGIVDF